MKQRHRTGERLADIGAQGAGLQDGPAHCVLCGRAIPPGAKSSRHHLVPRLKGGTHLGTVRLHQICHSAIHARYTEAEIARRLADPAALRDDPELSRFVAWVRTKPDDFHAPTRTARGRTAKWK